MAARRPSATSKPWVVAALVAALCPLPAMAQNAPGVLPWATRQAEGGAAHKKNNGKNGNHGNQGKNGKNHRNHNGGRRGSSPQGSRGFSQGLLQSLAGTAYFGFDGANSAQRGGESRTSANDFGFNLQERGFLFDPRLWTHNLSVQLDRTASNAPFQSTATRSLGWDFNGTLFGARSFPLRVFFSRHTANTDFSAPGDLRTSFRNLGLTWSLNRPKLANLTLTALSGKTDTDATAAFLPFQEQQRSLAASLTRSVNGWSLSANADYSRVKSSLNEYQYILRGQDFRAQHAVGERGEFSTSIFHQLRTESDRNRPFTRYALTTFESALTYRHSEKLQGFYSLHSLTNLREATILAALRASTGGGGAEPSVEPNPALQQAMLSEGGSSSRTAQAGWNYAATSRLSFNASLAHTSLSTPEVRPEDQGLLLKSYSTVGGGVNYHRPFGRWDTTWRAGLFRNWNRPLLGAGYADNSRSMGLGVTRDVARWRWVSDFTYSEYTSGLATGTLYRQERWANALEKRLSRRLRFNFGAELFHLNSNFGSLRQISNNLENGLLLHGTFSDRNWTATVGRGLRNVNSAIIRLDLENPLNAVVLSQVNPLAAPLSNADRYTYLLASFRASRNLSFQASYRRDNFILPAGDFNRSTDVDFSAAYRLRKMTVTFGYRRQLQATTFADLNRDRFYLRMTRPFRLF